MVDHAALRKKYPKWAHRHAYHKKKRRRSRSRRRRRARAAEPSTNVLLMQLLHQIMGGTVRPLARKHGENVVTGYAGAVTPDRLPPLRWRSPPPAPLPVARAAGRVVERDQRPAARRRRVAAVGVHQGIP